MSINIKIDISHISKFDGTYFNIWKHRLTLLFKSKNYDFFPLVCKQHPLLLWLLKLSQEAAILPTTRVGSIAKWDDKDVIAIQVINNCSNNNIVSNVK